MGLALALGGVKVKRRVGVGKKLKRKKNPNTIAYCFQWRISPSIGYAFHVQEVISKET